MNQTEYQERRERLLPRIQKLQIGLSKFLRDHQELGNAQELMAIGQYQVQLTNMIEELQPHRIGVVGSVSCGKSRLLNTLLGTLFAGMMPPNGLLMSGNGRTTGIPFEIQYSTTYRAEIYFINQDDVKAMLTELSLAYQCGEGKKPAAYAIVARLKRIFSQVPENNNNPQDLLPLEASLLAPFNGVLEAHAPYDFIGKSPEVLTALDLQELADLLRPFFVQPVGRTGIPGPAIAACVSKIRLFLPSPALPPNVILVDTPGIGDSDYLNVQRTRALYSSFDEVWFLSTLALSISQEPESNALKEIIPTGCRLKIVATQCGVESYRDRVEIDKNLIKIFSGYNLDVLSQEQELQWNMIADSTLARINAIPIAYTELSHGAMDGIDEISNWLAGFGAEEVTRLTSIEEEFRVLLLALQATGVRHIQFPLDQLREWRDRFVSELIQLSAMPVLLSSISNSYHRAITSWGDLRSVNAAIRRNGGPHYSANKGIYDLNRDIAFEWSVQTGQFRQSFVDFFTRLIRDFGALGASLQDVEAIQALNQSLNQLRKHFQDTLSFCFDESITSDVRYLSERMDIYPLPYRHHYVGKKHVTYHSPEEFRNIFDELIRRVSGEISRCHQLLNSVYHSIRHLTENPMLAFQDADELLQIVQTLDDPAPVEVICPISLQRLENPIEVTPCHHVFSSDSIEQWLLRHPTCPLCRQGIQAQRRRYDLQALLELMNPPVSVAPSNTWIRGMWPSIVAETIALVNEQTDAADNDEN